MKKWLICFMVLLWNLSLQALEEKEPVSFGLHTCCPSVFYEKAEGDFLLSMKVDGQVYSVFFEQEQELADALDQVIAQIDFTERYHSFACILQGPREALSFVEQKLQELTTFFDQNRCGDDGLVSREKRMIVKQGWDLARDNIGPKTEEAKPFFELSLKEKDKKIIRDLIEGIAETPLLQLALPSEQSRLKKLGDKAKVVHPLRFIGFILSDPELRKLLKDISESSFKWPRFVDGFEAQMKEEAKLGNLFIYLPGFVELLGVDLQPIQELAQKKDYAGIIEFFL